MLMKNHDCRTPRNGASYSCVVPERIVILNRPMRFSRGTKRWPAAKHGIHKLWYLVAALITGVALAVPASLAHAATSTSKCVQIGAQVCVNPSNPNHVGLAKG
jgi:hypothetical protein